MRKNIRKRVVLPKKGAGRGARHGAYGFTLLEMLLVVAIIAILILISLPLIDDSLETVKIRVDTANERTAMGLAEANYLITGNVLGDE